MSGTDLKLYIKTISGGTIEIHVKKYFLIIDCKYLIFKQKHIAIDEQRLLFAGKQLENDAKLDECGINNEATLNLVLKMKGS